MWVFFRQHLHSPVLLVTYRRTVEVPTEPLLTCSLEVSIHVLAMCGWEQSLELSWGLLDRESSQSLGCSSKRGGSVTAPLETRRYGSTPGLEDLLAHSHVPLHHAVLVELVSGVCTGTEKILRYLRTPPCRTPSNNPAEGPPGLCWQRWPPGPRQVMS